MRGTEDCLDFAITAVLIDPGRVNIFERWESQEALEAFRTSGSRPSASCAVGWSIALLLPLVSGCAKYKMSDGIFSAGKERLL